MQIEVGPARRPGNVHAIYDEPLKEPDLETNSDGSVTMTIDALGIRCDKSRYRYRIRLSRSDANRLTQAIGKH
jgi:hypothetical protein